MTETTGFLEALVLLATALAAGCAVPAKPVSPLDDAAARYVKLVLAVGRHDKDYVDAYYGDPAWKEQAAAGPPVPLETLAATAKELRAAVRAAEGPDDRKRYLEKQLVAVEAFLRRLSGEKLTLDEECRLLYDAVPPRHTIEEFREAQTRLEALVPGSGPLPDRIEGLRRSVRVPKERLEATVRAALATARTANQAHVSLPEGESFETALVSGKPWGAYNWYLGGYKSRIEMNTDLPVQLNDLLGTMCHEGYPGHHTYNALLESALVRGKGWVEYTVYPLYSPQSFLAEGSANVGEDLLYGDDERRRVLTQVLAPVAGVDPAAVLAYDAVREATRPLKYVRPEAMRMLLDDGAPEADVLAYLTRWALLDDSRARKAIEFGRVYRSYVFNYSYGEDVVRGYIGTGKDKVERFYDILSRPVVPSDLTAR